MSQTQLAKLTGIDRSTLAELVARLLDQGYLQRRRTKDDGRTNALRRHRPGGRLSKPLSRAPMKSTRTDVRRPPAVSPSVPRGPEGAG